jgi:O-acetyl-ADP-ribose deacetylase (regulator of RNase III)
MDRVEYVIGATRFVLLRGDITLQDTEAIVNAANNSLLGGGGVDGAIHAAAGQSLLEECKKIISRIGSLSTGEAVTTTGGDLIATYVIHTVGPVWFNGKQNEEELLCHAYTSCLEEARSHGIRSLSFPSISTGAYRFPVRRAAPIALSAIRDFVKTYDRFAEIRIVTWSEDDFAAYRAEADSLFQ